MAGKRTKGNCIYCNKSLTKSGMQKHLPTCQAKKDALEKLKSKEAKLAEVYHIMVEGRHASDYWLHLRVKANMKLQTLDSFLRDIWLECCGHLSAFRLDGISYSSYIDDDFGDESMDITLKKILRKGLKFLHEYDFGSTTELVLTVVDVGKEPYSGDEIQTMSRNESPLIECTGCGKPATEICTQCVWEGGGLLCEECAEEHECGEEMLLPVVNSPRTGVCGYEG